MLIQLGRWGWGRGLNNGVEAGQLAPVGQHYAGRHPEGAPGKQQHWKQDETVKFLSGTIYVPFYLPIIKHNITLYNMSKEVQNSS